MRCGKGELEGSQPGRPASLVKRGVNAAKNMQTLGMYRVEGGLDNRCLSSH